MPFPSPGDLPDPRIEPTSSVSPALAGIFLTPEPPGKPLWNFTYTEIIEPKDQMLAEIEVCKLGLFMSFWKCLENSMI